MNINMLRDTDNDPGIYAAACSIDPQATWRGASLWVSIDGGANYTNIATLTNETTMGLTTTLLGDFHGGNMVDELNSVNVALRHGSLSSTTLAGLLSGVNMCVIGDEILCFRTATLQSNGTYTLRGLLRGRRGSEYAMGIHVASERFVLVDPTKMVRIAQSTADIGLEKLYKPVSGYSTLAATASQTFRNLGMGLKPYAPVHIGGGRNAAGDVIANWVRRGRLSGEWRDGVDVPLSESSESYEAEVWTSGFAVLKRTITGLTAPTLTYSAADQTSDFGSLQSDVSLKVYQMSSIVGRGHAASGVV